MDVDTDIYKQANSTIVEYHAHLAVSCMLVAFNIATAGYFTWNSHPNLHPIYEVRDNFEGPSTQVLLSAEHPKFVPSERILTKLDVENAVVVFLPLVQDKSLAARTEYIKGLLHLGASYHDINFYREAFGNFYRSLENCVTQKILATKKLTNEVAQIKKALSAIGADETLQAAFGQVYVVRSSQVAHAQNEPVNVTFEEVQKVKALADLVLGKTYRAIAEKNRLLVRPV